MIHLYKYNKKFDKGYIMFYENKIKLVTSVKGVVFSLCYTYPPKCLCTTILGWKLGVSQNHKKTKDEIELKFKIVKLVKWKTRSQLIRAMWLTFQSGRTKPTYTKNQECLEKEINM